MSTIPYFLLGAFLVHILANFMEHKATRDAWQDMLDSGKIKDGDILEESKFYAMFDDYPKIRKWFMIKIWCVIYEVFLMGYMAYLMFTN